MVPAGVSGRELARSELGRGIIGENTCKEKFPAERRQERDFSAADWCNIMGRNVTEFLYFHLFTYFRIVKKIQNSRFLTV